MTVRALRVGPVFLLFLVALAPACSGGGGAEAGRDGASGADTGTDGSIDGSLCVQVPTLGPSDLSCDSDEDCMAVWSGTVCSCQCACPSAAANVAAQARLQSELSPVFSASCAGPGGCECPALTLARCFSHQCAACANPAFGGTPLPNQPAACTEDAGTGDGGG
jgi:hypothetical protein